jgi:two-component system phosphate regulon response regulator PhoB
MDENKYKTRFPVGVRLKPRVLLVEDELDIQELLLLNMERSGYLAEAVENVSEALNSIHKHVPDLVLVDWMLPGPSGVELVRRLRADERTREIPIIMLTARAEEADKLLGLEVGADDYMTKPFSVRELQARIKALMRRRLPQLNDESVYLKNLVLDPTTYQVTLGTKKIELGPTEFKLLHFFITHPERVYSRSQILDQVWGDHVFIEERTVDVHIKRLRNALEDAEISSWIQTIRGAGYRMVPPE